MRKNALHLARGLWASPDATLRKPDLLTVELAALLHDVLDKKYVSAAQAADPYAFFLPFFQRAAAEHGVDLVQDGRAAAIARIVTNVSWSTEKKLREAGKLEVWHRECVELHCVQDADRLDAIGAFGACKSLTASTRSFCLIRDASDRHPALRCVQRIREPVSWHGWHASRIARLLTHG